MITDTTFKSNKIFVYYTVKLGFVSSNTICRRVPPLIKKNTNENVPVCVPSVRASVFQFSNCHLIFFCCISKDDKIIFIITHKIQLNNLVHLLLWLLLGRVLLESINTAFTLTSDTSDTFRLRCVQN